MRSSPTSFLSWDSWRALTTSKYLRRGRLGPRSVLLGLILEIAAVFALGWVPGSFPDMAFTGIIAYVAAFQVASFRRVDQFAYNSTFMTGNLRDVAEGIYDAFTPGASPEVREKGRAQAWDLGLICLCFLAGAILGAWAARRYGNRSLWFAEPFCWLSSCSPLAAGVSCLRGPDEIRTEPLRTPSLFGPESCSSGTLVVSSMSPKMRICLPR